MTYISISDWLLLLQIVPGENKYVMVKGGGPAAPPPIPERREGTPPRVPSRESSTSVSIRESSTGVGIRESTGGATNTNPFLTG